MSKHKLNVENFSDPSLWHIHVVGLEIFSAFFMFQLHAYGSLAFSLLTDP